MASIYSKYFERDKQFKPKLHNIPPPVHGKINGTQSSTNLTKNLNKVTGNSPSAALQSGAVTGGRGSSAWNKPKAVITTSIIPNGTFAGQDIEAELKRRSKSPAVTRDIFRKSLQKSFNEVGFGLASMNSAQVVLWQTQLPQMSSESKVWMTIPKISNILSHLQLSPSSY